jgi:hypothetical protein
LDDITEDNIPFKSNDSFNFIDKDFENERRLLKNELGFSLSNIPNNNNVNSTNNNNNIVNTINNVIGNNSTNMIINNPSTS